MKFGGTSLADAGQFRKVKAIFESRSGSRFVVASAPGKRFSGDEKVTDLLYRYADTGDEEVLEAIRLRFEALLQELSLSLSLEADFDCLRQAQQQPGSRDFLVSRGEYLNSKVLAAWLGLPFLDAADAIFFRADGRLDEERTYAALGAQLKAAGEAVLPGFYGSLPDGTVRTFSRGGSDVTGAIAARAVQADLYENWTDVPGLLMADPTIVPHPAVIPEITYQELRVLAYMGAAVLHDEAIFPVREAHIPINIRNTNAPEESGTMIVSERTLASQQAITGIAGKTGFSAITVEKDKMNADSGFGRKILEALEACGVTPDHVPAGVDAMSVLVSTKALEGRKEELTQRILRATGADRVTIEDGIALLTVVGQGMVQMAGTAGRLMTAIARENIHIRLLEQCFEKTIMVIGIRTEEYAAAMQAVYQEFASN